MKKQIFIIAMMLFTMTVGANAQVGVQVNIGLQPLWGPVGYDNAQFYYLPDIGCYYNVAAGQFVYFNRGAWVTVNSLPPQYASFDLYHAYKVVINEPSPWLHNDRYKVQYAKFIGHHDQAVIRDSHDPKYFANPHHPMHAHYHPAPAGHDDHHADHHDDRR